MNENFAHDIACKIASEIMGAAIKNSNIQPTIYSNKETIEKLTRMATDIYMYSYSSALENLSGLIVEREEKQNKSFFQ